MQREDRWILRKNYSDSLIEAIREAFSRASVYPGHSVFFVAEDMDEVSQVLVALKDQLNAILVYARRSPDSYLLLSNKSEISIVSIDQLAWSLRGRSADTIICQQAVWREADLKIGLLPLLTEHRHNSLVSYGVGETCTTQSRELRKSIVEAGNGA